ncbi:MAG: FAD-dependent monooxygenase [Betaproteobacteria bacterium]
MKNIEIPVLIVGGGGCGLALSIFLSDLNIKFYTVEKNPITTDHPRAHILNNRTMEIMRQHGIADEIYKQGAPAKAMERISFRTTLGGDGPLDRKVIGNLDGYGGGELKKIYEKDSPCRATNLPLMQLEPLLLNVANTRSAGCVNFHHELIGFSQDENVVTSEIKDHQNDEIYTVRSKYLIAADGGKTIGRILDAEMVGPKNLRKMVNTYFEGDLSPWIDDDGVLIYYFINPDGKGQWAGGGLVKTGPTKWDRHSESWVFMREMSHDDPDDINEVNVVSKMRELLRLPDSFMPIVKKIGRWDVQGVVAKKYRYGRVFLAGDAAHRHPPVSALGLNTAFADAHNLAWKLQLVLQGVGSDELLTTYESERQPVGARVSEWALNGFRMRNLIDQAIGLSPGQKEENKIAFERLYSDTPGGETSRAILTEVMKIQRIGPQAHDMEIGYSYDIGALLSDHSPMIKRDPMAGIYYPNSRPGARLPHFKLRKSNNPTEILSSHDLITPGIWALISKDKDWRQSVVSTQERINISLKFVFINEFGDYDDFENLWDTLTQAGNHGAILVRPDAHIAFRTKEKSILSGMNLTTILQKCICQLNP